jgi:para-nitrobenzyl esterase
MNMNLAPAATIVVMSIIVTSGVAVAQVKTAGGLVKGSTSVDGRVRVFRGIPYAAPPVGALRWQEPRPAAPWKGTRDATENGAQCVQAQIFGDISFPRPASEDCLYLNVWTPARAAGDRLPVMMWIHDAADSMRRRYEALDAYVDAQRTR